MLLRLALFALLFTQLKPSVQGQNRAFWATIWSVNTPEKVDKIIQTAVAYHFNQIFIQVRYRADAVYFPNRIDSTFCNPEARSYILNESNFDVLAYAIERAKGTKIQIHAWVPIFVVTPHDLTKIGASHLYYLHPEWITCKKGGKIMPYDVHEGAFLDPGIPAVQTYLLNVLADIASNYAVDGIQLDYIRYPDSIYGYNPLAINAFKQSGSSNFNQWKQDQINGFVNKAYILLKNQNPKLIVSAAVFANQPIAIGKLSQNWKGWLKHNYIDQIYVMAYNTHNSSFDKILQGIKEVDKKKTNIVLRAWKDSKPYLVNQINEKIYISKHYGFHNLGFYSYSGLVENQYLNQIRFK